MRAGHCEREDDLLEALQRGLVGPELTSHAESCTACAELRLVAGALLDDRAGAIAEASVPSAGTMWWRIRMRQQQDAEAAARRSLMIGQTATLLVAVLVGAALFGADVAVGVRRLIASIGVSLPLAIGLAVWLVLAPVAGWVVSRRS